MQVKLLPRHRAVQRLREGGSVRLILGQTQAGSTVSSTGPANDRTSFRFLLRHRGWSRLLGSSVRQIFLLGRQMQS